MSELALNLVQAVLTNARRLGLKWTLTPATVDVAASTDNPMVPVIMDGDDVVINTTSLIGGLSSGIRVMVLSVPPGGNYIIGRYGDTSVRRSLVSSTNRESTSTLVLSTAAADVPGIAYTFILTRPSIVRVFFSGDAYCVASGATVVVMTLYINGVIQSPQIHSTLRVTEDRQTPGGDRAIALEPGSYSLQLHGVKTVAAGTHWLIAQNTRVTVDIYE